MSKLEQFLNVPLRHPSNDYKRNNRNYLSLMITLVTGSTILFFIITKTEERLNDYDSSYLYVYMPSKSPDELC